jgi:hypothetical protein
MSEVPIHEIRRVEAALAHRDSSPARPRLRPSSPKTPFARASPPLPVNASNPAKRSGSPISRVEQRQVCSRCGGEEEEEREEGFHVGA